MSLDVKRRQSTENFCNSLLDSSADVNRRVSVGKREPLKIDRRVSTENSRRVSIDSSRRNRDELSTEPDHRNFNNKHKRDPVKIKRPSVIEKGNKKVSGSDGCLYVGNSLQESQRFIRRSSSYDAISADKEKIDLQICENIRKSGSETYLVSKPLSESEEAGNLYSTDCLPLYCIHRKCFYFLKTTNFNVSFSFLTSIVHLNAIDHLKKNNYKFILIFSLLFSSNIYFKCVYEL